MVDDKVASKSDPLDPRRGKTLGDEAQPTCGPAAEVDQGLFGHRTLAWVKAALAFGRGLSLTNQFVMVATLVVCVSMVILGQWLSKEIEAGQIRSRAESGGLYMQGFLAPHIQKRGDGIEISARHREELDRLLFSPSFADRVAEFRVWRRDGTMFYSTKKLLTGKQVASADVTHAFAGNIVAQVERGPDDEHEVARFYPLLEIYAPIYNADGSEVIAVGEFYEDAYNFLRELSAAKAKAWAIVGTTTAAMMTLLYVIFRKANNVIELQHTTLATKLAEAEKMAALNRQLRNRAFKLKNSASQANERLINRIGADLHDGPVQLLTLLILRLGQKEGNIGKATVEPTAEALAKQILMELRELSNNLILPEIDDLNLYETVRLAVERHEKATGTEVNLTVEPLPETVDRSMKILMFRIIQEGLNNAFRHAEAKEQAVIVAFADKTLSIHVSDAGAGLGEAKKRTGQSHPLGLQGLRHRVEVFGGTVQLRPRAPSGAELLVAVPIDGRINL